MLDFHGIPLKIYNNSIKVTLVDSLNKRVLFLNEVINKLKIKNVEVVHSRAEDLARNKLYREHYNYAVSRAVAPLNILVEYLAPFVKCDGMIVALKGSNSEEEINNSKNAMRELNCEIFKQKKILLPENSGERNNIFIKKIKILDNKYPRKAGIPKKNPL